MVPFNHMYLSCFSLATVTGKFKWDMCMGGGPDAGTCYYLNTGVIILKGWAEAQIICLYINSLLFP